MMDLHTAIETVDLVLRRIADGTLIIWTEPGDYIYDAIKICLEEQLKSNPNPDVHTNIIGTYSTVEFCMSWCQEGPIDRPDPKSHIECQTCLYEDFSFNLFPCSCCSKYSHWRSK